MTEPTATPVDAGPPDVAAVPGKEPKRRKKRKARRRDATRRLDPWDLYRTLSDATDESYELLDVSNREVRFALILMSGQSAALFLAASRSDFGANLAPLGRILESVALSVYALLALGFLLQAIAALRPGKFRPILKEWSRDREDFPQGVRYFEDVVERDLAGHWAAWRRVTVGQLNAELAVQVHSLCLKNQARTVALRRLYGNLRIQTITFALVLVLYLVFQLV